MLVLGLRRGEVLGLPWVNVNLDINELDVNWQLERTGRQLYHRETKTPGSDAPLLLPGLCATALKLQAERQAAWKLAADDAWHDSGLVVTTRYGTPFEPRNFNRQFTPPGAARPGSATSSHTAGAAPAHRCLLRSTFTLAWPCGYCGAARSPSRWSFTPRSPTTSPARRFDGWGSSLTASNCCTFVLHQDQTPALLSREPGLRSVETWS